MPNLSRRGFMRVALLGAAGAATVAACPEWLEDLLKPRKTYFLPSLCDLQYPGQFAYTFMCGNPTPQTLFWSKQTPESEWGKIRSVPDGVFEFYASLQRHVEDVSGT